ncbi:MAG TPA: ABC transporter ATP-binding protein [Planctomycetaceae bacterium]|nr:ABC transporter ATP-binding protein [Planctomycetaceae bacterium]
MILVENLSLRVGAFALSGVTFQVSQGEYGILMGRTGCGKTTIMESICGLRPILSGRIVLMGRDVTRLKPAERCIGFVPQDGALFPTMTVRQHLAFALVIRKWKRRQIERRVDELAELLGIQHLLHRMPAGLSGGERQRVALGRALAARPGVLCLDEPLSALDDQTREEMYALLKSVREATGVTTLHITHSRSEAERLGDRLFWLHDGVIRPIPIGELHSVPELSAGTDDEPRQREPSAVRKTASCTEPPLSSGTCPSRPTEEPP